MRLESLYRVTFTTPESWNVTREGGAGSEGQSFLIAEGRAEGRLSARYRAANYPRRRVDGALEPEFRGALETDDGAIVLFHWEGLASLTDSGMRQLLEPPSEAADGRLEAPSEERGVTVLAGTGAYTGEERPVLYCVVSRAEIAQIKAIVHEADPTAFMVIGVAHEALGDDHQDRGRHEVGLDAEVEHAGHGPRGVVGVQGREHQVSGEGCLDGDFSCFIITNLTDHDDVRILSQQGPDTGGKIDTDIRLYLQLVKL